VVLSVLCTREAKTLQLLHTRAEAKHKETTGASRQEPFVWGKLLPALELFFQGSSLLFLHVNTPDIATELTCCWRRRVMKQ
jgi:hypothetical protein